MSALELKNIHKTFGSTVALSDASLIVAPGTIHALLGENGAGKSTLMRIAFGMLQPDAGVLDVDGHERRFHSPGDAIASGIGMVHQHFALVPVMTVAENIALGGRGRYHRQATVRAVTSVAEKTGLSIDASARVSSLTVGGQQRVEIVKALTRGARILILDEPTAVLPPLEAESLLDWLGEFVRSGSSAILITHKVREALRVADHVTVLRQGRTVLSAPRSEVSEAMLATMMVDQTRVVPPRARSPSTEVVAALEDVSVLRHGRVVIDRVTLSVRAGEILGIAGVEGAGHHDLLRVLAGRTTPNSGERKAPSDVGFIPEDRHRDALALDMSSTENVVLRGAARRRGLIPWSALRRHTQDLVTRGDVRGPAPDAPVRQLSGGNQQKLVVARELDGNPALLVAENPTRGLDLRATRAVHDQLIAARSRGAAVVMYSSDVDELLSLADRIIVVHAGVAHEVTPAADTVARALVGIAS